MSKEAVEGEMWLYIYTAREEVRMNVQCNSSSFDQVSHPSSTTLGGLSLLIHSHDKPVSLARRQFIRCFGCAIEDG